MELGVERAKLVGIARYVFFNGTLVLCGEEQMQETGMLIIQ